MGRDPETGRKRPDILLTTQYLDEADRLASGPRLIEHGKVIAAGDAHGAERPAPGNDMIEGERPRTLTTSRRSRSTGQARSTIQGWTSSASRQVAVDDGSKTSDGRAEVSWT